MLNVILEDLAQTYDFETVRATASVNFSTSGPTTMPANWLRGVNRGVFYTVDSQPYVMINITQEEYDALSKQPGLASFPSYYYVDVSGNPPANLLYAWPPPSGTYPITARYLTTSTIITTPESSTTIPWFPSTDYLITRLSAEMMKFSDDTRVKAYLGDANDDGDMLGAAGILRRYMKMKDDPEATVNTVQLDRRRFGRAFSRLPNTKIIGW